MLDLGESVPSMVVPKHVFIKAVKEIPASVFDANNEEELLFLRHRNKRQYKQELTFEFSRDPALLQQYYAIYEEQFRVVHNANRYHHDTDDEHDKRGHILIVRQGNLCVGGARLSVKTPRQPHPLPIEIDGFRFEDHFPELASHEMSYGQLGRICLLPEFRGGDITRTMLYHVYRKSAALGLDVVFATASLVNARLYMRVSKLDFVAKGLLKDTRMHPEVELPKYPMCEEIKFYLLSLILTDKGNATPEARHSAANSVLEEETAV